MSNTKGSLTSIEQIAVQLDDARRQRMAKVQEQVIDFDRYMDDHDNADIAAVKPPKSFRDELHDEFYGEGKLSGLTLPWAKTHDRVRIRYGEVTGWLGFNGHMKSFVTGYVAADMAINQDEKVCVMSFEMKPRKTLKRMACQVIGTTNPSPEFVDKFLNAISQKIWLYDQQGSVSVKRVLGVIYYCAEQLGIKQFLIDSLMKVVGDEDDYNGQKRFIDALCTAAKDLDVHIHVVHHSRKREDESKRPGKMDAKGSGSIVDQLDNFVSVFKVPRKQDDDPNMPTHMLFWDKQRNGEWEGQIALWFDEITTQFKESITDRVKRFL